MNVTVQVQLAADDKTGALRNVDKLAASVLSALGGDPAKDSCHINVSASASIVHEPERPAA